MKTGRSLAARPGQGQCCGGKAPLRRAAGLSLVPALRLNPRKF
jgi:hypothetical protein